MFLLPFISDTQYTKKAFNTFTSIILEGDVSFDEEEVGVSGPVSIQKNRSKWPLFTLGSI